MTTQSYRLAADFQLYGIDGKKHRLSEERGKPTVLFFFCGCQWCHATASAWSQLQVEAKYGGMDYIKNAKTVIVYSGDVGEAKQFERDTNLQPASTLILLDPLSEVSVMQYDAEPCPRGFVLTSHQQIIYTNDHADDAPRSTSTSVLISRIVTALANADWQNSTEGKIKSQ